MSPTPVTPIQPAGTPSHDIQHYMRPGTLQLPALPPLSVYVHLPWCLRKCPYCDFNSHERASGTNAGAQEQRYIAALQERGKEAEKLIAGEKLVLKLQQELQTSVSGATKASKEKALAFLDRFTGEKPFVKIGMELFYAEGPSIVREIKARGHKIFLDLKLHDIPNTVKKAMAALSSLDVDMVNLHAAGTRAMMSAALEGLTRADGTRPMLIAVTQLTSTSQQSMEEEIGIHRPLEEVVIDYAKNARLAGLDGVVCSPLEAGRIHETCTKDFLTITPGIRFADAKADDQVRITTPAKAREIGSDYIVVGRPITQAEDPVAAYRRCVSEFVG